MVHRWGRLSAELLLVLVLLLGVPVVGQTDVDTGSTSIEIGASFGMLWFDADMQLATYGGFAAVELSPGFSASLHYNTAAITLLGFDLLRIHMIEGRVAYDLMMSSGFGIQLAGGVGYMLASSLGEGIGGTFFPIGVGVVFAPMESLRVSAQYVPRVKYGILHAVEANISARF